jgi:hypothetical protein
MASVIYRPILMLEFPLLALLSFCLTLPLGIFLYALKSFLKSLEFSSTKITKNSFSNWLPQIILKVATGLILIAKWSKDNKSLKIKQFLMK